MPGWVHVHSCVCVGQQCSEDKAVCGRQALLELSRSQQTTSGWISEGCRNRREQF